MNITFLVNVKTCDIETLIFLTCGVWGGRQSFLERFTV
jgi:hypothetical protein